MCSFVAALLLLSAGSPAAPQTAPSIALSEVTVATQPDTVTVFVKTSATPRYQADLIERPNRLVIDFEDTSYGWRTTPLPVSATPVKQVRGGQYRPGVARLVVELTRRVGYAIREEDTGLAIIIPTAPLLARADTGAPRQMAAVTTMTADTPTMAPAPAAPASATAGKPASVDAPPTTDARPAMKAPTRSFVRIAQAPRQPPARPATPSTLPPSAPVSESQRLISLDFKDADVVNLLRILAAESNRNIVIGDDVKGKMSISLRNVAWELALDTILESRGLVKTERDGVMRIVTSDQLTREREARARVEEAKVKAETEIRTKMAEAQLKEAEAQAKKLAADAAVADAVARGPLREETIRLSYADPEIVANPLRGILGIPPGPQGMIPTSGAPIPAGPGYIPAPPFSQLFGPNQAAPTAPLVSPSADVLAKGITIQAYKPTNSIFIRHYAADVERIKKLILEKLDIPLPQVKIEARMEILSRQDLYAIGVQWGGGGVLNTSKTATLVGRGFTSDPVTNPTTGGTAPSITAPGAITNPNLTLSGALPVSAATGLAAGGNIVNLPIGALLQGAAAAGAGGLAFGIIGSRLNLNLALEALNSVGKTRTLARPEVVTVENGTASVSLGEQIPYATVSSAGTQIQFVDALLRLEVTPTVVRESDANRIKMKVVVENNSRGTDVINLGTAGAPPVINKRKAETEVLIKEGERLVIGGVAQAESDEQTRKVPLFGDIPILGWLFKQYGVQRTSTELVVFITPTVLRRDAPAASVPGTTAPRR